MSADDDNRNPTKLDDGAAESLRDALGAGAFRDLVQTFLTNSSSLETKLDEALAARDAKEAERCAHDLKSTSAIFGATTLSDVYAELELRAKEGDFASLVAAARAAAFALGVVRASLRELALTDA